MNTPFNALPRYIIRHGKPEIIGNDEWTAPQKDQQQWMRVEDVERYFAYVQLLRGETAAAVMRLGSFLDK